MTLGQYKNLIREEINCDCQSINFLNARIEKRESEMEKEESLLLFVFGRELLRMRDEKEKLIARTEILENILNLSI